MPKDHSSRRHGEEEDDRGKYFSDSPSSVTFTECQKRDRKRERRRKKSHKSRRYDDDEDGDDERRSRRHSSSRRDKKKKKKRHKKSSKDKRKKDRKRNKKGDESSSYISSSDTDSDSEYSRRHRYKRSKKERKRRRKENTKDDDKRKKSRIDAEDDISKNNLPSPCSIAENVTRALHGMLVYDPDFAAEIPLILIRLAGGTTFDLCQVTDFTIAKCLRLVFEALESFGVKKQESSGMWMFQNPPGATQRNELVLLKVIRSLLDECGLTMEEIDKYENENEKSSFQKFLEQPEERQKMEELTKNMLEKFRLKDATLGSQLATLCKTIVEGESISIDGIPDEDLKTALESLFETCGLEKSEIEEDDGEDDDDDEESDESPLMGYGLPDAGEDSDAAQIKLAIIMAACRQGPPKQISVGPMRRPMTKEEEQAANAIYVTNNAKEREEEDEGPLLPGEARKARGPAMSLDMIKAQADYRELQLKATAAGVDMPIEGGGREEWMIIPGQHDFLSGIKSGQAIKSRGFQNKKSGDADKNSPAIHPAVQAEMDAIMHAHQNARGPSLMDLHHSKKSKEKELASRTNTGKKEWNWSRDKDLDAGRRVDKDALGMILGGAAGDLKTKFAGGFNR